jgi:membrane-associated PAP2 superfamily phosphatase
MFLTLDSGFGSIALRYLYWEVVPRERWGLMACCAMGALLPFSGIGRRLREVCVAGSTVHSIVTRLMVVAVFATIATAARIRK